MTKIFAHRGLSYLYPENSLEAIKEACTYDYIYGIEFDVRMTKDKKFVIIHDADITLVSNGTGLVHNMTLDELYKYDFSFNTLDNKYRYLKSFIEKDGHKYRKYMKNKKNKSYKITTLESVLMTVKNKKLLVEIKTNNDKDFDLNKFYNIIKKYNTRNIMIHSFDMDVINKLRKKDASLNLGIIIGLTDINKKLEMNVDFFSIEYSKVDKEIIDDKNVNIWTINSCRKIKKLKSNLGNLFRKINIITDNPKKIYKSLKLDE